MINIALIPVVQQIVDGLKPVLVFLHDSIGLGWGMAIVALTVIVRGAMLPLAIKQYRSMQKMALAAPEIKRVQEKYKDDKQRQQQELMKFYGENEINPFAACLPLLIQLPFFIGLFYLLRTDLRREICGQTKVPCGELERAVDPERFLFIPDLTDKATGGVLVTLIVLYVGTQLLSSALTMTATVDKNQRMLMYALPFLFVLFVINFPAGLIVYWITTNSWTLFQQLGIRRKLGPMRPPKEPDPDGDDDSGGGGNIFSKITKAAPLPEGPKAPAAPPPPPPRKKKKRSGRRR